MKWIGQHIYDLVSRFRDDVYLEDLTTTRETNVLVVDSTGKVSKSTTLADDLESDVEASIDTLPYLTSFGSAGFTTNIVAGDLTMYNAVNDGNPTLSIGSSATNRFEISVPYNSETQTLCDVDFKTYTTSGTTNDGRFSFFVDEVVKVSINDTSLGTYGTFWANAAGAYISTQNTTASSATEGGNLKLIANDGAAMADDHRLGVIEFRGAEDGSNTLSIGARIQAICRDAWDGSNNDADLEFYTTDGTTESKVLTLDADKLATFTGAVTASGQVSSTTTGHFVATNTTTSSATQGGSLTLISNDGATLADDHRLGGVYFRAAQTDGTLITGASIQAFADALWANDENGSRLEFYVTDGDSSHELALTLDSDLLATFAGAVTVTGALTGTLATASQPNVTGVGTITTGVWNGTAIAAAYMATGTTSAQGALELATTAEADSGTDTARAVTPEGLKSHVDARYSNSIIPFTGQAVMVSSGNWVLPGKGGISNHTWNKDIGVNTETNGTTEAAIPKQWAQAGVRVPFACIVDGISCIIQNTNGNRQATVGLFFARAADGTTAVDWGSGDDTEPILQIHADANNESGSYTTRPSHAEVTGSDIAMAAGDVFYPAIKLTGETGGSGATDGIYATFNVHIKTLLV